MNCNSVEEKLSAIARGQLFDAENKREALAHTEYCVPCAERLNREQILSSQLKTFTVAMSEVSASPKIETALREAFKTKSTQTKVVQFAPHRKNQRGVWAVGGAIAASFLAIGVLVTQSFVSTPNTQKTLAAVILGADEIEKAIESINRQPQENSPTESPQNLYAVDRNGQRIKPVSVKKHKAVKRDEEIRETEIATEFISLQQEGLDSMPANGQVVRVKLKHSALIAYGLPIDMERANENVTADVVLSEEGVACAIRFVHTTKSK